MSMEIIGQGKFLQLLNHNGWEYAERKKVSAIVAIIAEHQGKALVIEQFRPALGKRVIEWPAGLVGDVPGQENEDIVTAAQRELEEETGYRATRLQLLTYGPASAGLSNEIIHIFRAYDLVKVSAGGGVDDENITVHLVPLSEIDAWLRQKQQEDVLVDLKFYSGLYFLQH
ncbi:NUDIX hydrolase [bacterium]|nr:NUDIX hydrolase [bacterium]